MLDADVFLGLGLPGEGGLVGEPPQRVDGEDGVALGELEDDGTRRVYFELNGQPRDVVVVDKSAELKIAGRPKADPTVPGEVGAPMQGKVVTLAVSVGEEVVKGDTLLSTEAMKMETTITSPVGGTVASVEVKEGEDVGAGDLLVRISPKG